MDRVAKATEKSEKHLQKIADKTDSNAANTQISDEPDESKIGIDGRFARRNGRSSISKEPIGC